MRRWLFVFLLLGSASTARAQVWQRDSVLSRLRTIDIIGDSSGFLWCSNETGVFRYDGQQAVPLADLLAPGSPRLPVGLTHLVQGADGTLWCGTQDGLFRLALPARRIERIPLPSLPNGQTSIDGILVHPRTGHLWVTCGTLYTVVVAGGRAVGPPVRMPEYIYATDFDATADGLRLFCLNGDMWHLAPRGHLQPLPRARQPFRWRVPGTTGRWQFDLDALYDATDTATTRAGRRVVRWGSNPFRLYLFRPVAHGRTWYWLSANGQLVALTPSATGQPPRVELPAAPERLPPGCVIRTSANGALWVSDPAAGTYWLALGRWPTHALTVRGAAANKPTNLSFRSINRLPPPDGRLLVATYSGLLTQATDSPTAPLRPLPLRGVPVFGFEVHDILRTRTGRLLVANETGVPAGELDLQQRSYTPYAWTNPADAIGCGSCLLEDGAGQLWAGTSRGLYRIDPTRRTLTRYRAADATYPLHVCLIEQLAEAPAGVLWAATDRGLYRLTVATGELRHYGPDEADPTRRLPSLQTLCVRAPHPDSVWIGTRDQGLLLLNPRRGLVRRVGTAEGLPHAAVASILPDPERGVLWLGTFDGLARYSVRTGQVRRFGAADGLAATDLNRQSAWRDPVSGWVYFGGVGGLTRVAPTGPSPLAAPRLLLTAIRQHLGAADTVLTRYFDGAPPADGLHLAAVDRFVELALALADQTSAEPPRYTYRLAGEADPQFRPVPDGYRLRLDHLTPGDYVVEIKALTAHGVAAGNVLHVPLHVAGYWWRHPLAWAAGAVLLAGLAAAAVYAWQQQRTARLLREHALRARIAADLHDDVGNLLTQISMQSSLLREKQHAPDQLLARLDRLATTARQAAQQMNDVIWGLGDESQTVAQLITRMRDHAYEMLAPTGIELDFRAEEASGADLPLEIRQHLYLIFKEALHNVVKHAQATQVAVRFSRAAGRIELLVHDNGRSDAAAGRPGGNGLRNMRTRAETLGGQLDAQPQANGFRVQVWLPV
jgi:signal transduction histidine kinase